MVVEQYDATMSMSLDAKPNYTQQVQVRGNPHYLCWPIARSSLRPAKHVGMTVMDNEAVCGLLCRDIYLPVSLMLTRVSCLTPGWHEQNTVW